LKEGIIENLPSPRNDLTLFGSGYAGLGNGAKEFSGTGG
jgi:hypothetical protein